MSSFVVPVPIGLRKERMIVSVWLCVWALANAAVFQADRRLVPGVGIVLVAATWYVSHFELTKRVSLCALSLRGVAACLLSGAGLFCVVWFISVAKGLAVFGYVPAVQAAAAALVSPVNEEIVFRGLLYRLIVSYCQRLRIPRVGEVLAIGITSLLFAMAHQRSSVFFVITLFLGAAYGIARWKTGSVMAGLWCHIAYNSLSLLGFGR